ncbi:MAG: Coenzyme F420 hydrogenase/dehydrogenase, beta subunit C-terminal domain [Planctomycetes bacterium]|nr:Coenzyme F420 hydrogenase/dehydrogenase, beta subunit C-terminal domain [Planctomycetota bacterium]
MTDFDYLQKNVIDRGLCLRCGECVGICPTDAIFVKDFAGLCLPAYKGPCVDCSLCYDLCPGDKVDFPLLARESHPTRHSPYLGDYRRIFYARSTDPEIVAGAASGGIATELLLHALESGRVDGCVVVDFEENRPWMPAVKVVRTREEIVRAAQSKYALLPVAAVLKRLKRDRGRYAVVALPCQIHGLRMMQQKIPLWRERIKYMIGLYCMNMLFYEATRSLFERFRIRDPRRIARMNYRAGAYPGNFEVEETSGRSHRLSKFGFNHLTFFYTMPRCLTCTDQTAELADVAVGDGWKGIERERGVGQSVVITRSVAGDELFESAFQAGLVARKELALADALRMHSNVLDYKKRGGPARVKILRRLGRPVPVYDQDVPAEPLPWHRYVVEALLLLGLRVLSTRLARGLLRLVPLAILDRGVTKIRGVWRYFTRRKIGRRASGKVAAGGTRLVWG